MAFDATYMGCVLSEIRDRCAGARVEKIHQPSRDTVILHLRCKDSREKLLFAANPAAPRLHLTSGSPENPAQPPMFCMLLRKHLMGGRLVDIRQVRLERAVSFVFDCIDEMGYPVQRSLVAELMGRTCNLYLLGPDGRIMDCLRRVGLDETARPALPGLVYRLPEPVTKLEPLQEEPVYREILEAPGADVLSSRLMDTLGGLSPLVCREAALYAAGDVDARVSALDIGETAQKLRAFFLESTQHAAPYYYAAPDGTPKQFAFCPIREYGNCQRADSFCALLDTFYARRDNQDALRQKSQGLRKTVNNLISRLDRKLALQEKELAATYDRERLRQLGDILTANLHRVPRGAASVECEDFYDEEMRPVAIPLNPTISPQQNAAKFYKDYTRMKNAEKELTRQLTLGGEEREYLKSVAEELNRAESDAALEEVRQELQSGGYVKADAARKRMKQSKLPPMAFQSTDGFPILVGRNNRQNEELTFKIARKGDIWCHASKVHGSHVLIQCGGQPVPDDTVTQACQLAAHYAETTGGQNIPVDVTQARQVKKIPNGKPGMVIYHTYRTVIVNPYPDIRIDPLNAEKG